MAWPDDIAGDLPAPRDDEPASLRQDIIDELSDHLQCAMIRELHRTANETTAKRTALERFGDPGRIAYRLWFEAMKEKIMSQRIVLAMLVIVAAAAIFVGAMTWRTAERMQSASLAMLEQEREVSRAILDKLATLSISAAAPATTDVKSSSTLIPASVKLLKETADGLPAIGYRVRLYGTNAKGDMDSESPNYAAVAGTDGVADFGDVEPRKYLLMILTPWQECLPKHVTLSPGKPYSKTFVCPAQLGSSEVSIEIDLPEDLKATGLWACCSFAQTGRSLENEKWTAPAPERNVWIDNNGRLSERFTQLNRAIPPLEWKSQLAWDHREWSLMGVSFSIGPDWVDDPQPQPAQNQSAQPQLPRLIYTFQDVDGPFGSGQIEEDECEVTVDGKTVWKTRAKPPVFQVGAGKPDHWKITLPEPMIAQLRAATKKIAVTSAH